MLRGGRPAAAAVLGGRAGCMFILVQRKHFFEVERGLGPDHVPKSTGVCHGPGQLHCWGDFVC